MVMIANDDSTMMKNDFQKIILRRAPVPNDELVFKMMMLINIDVFM